MFYFLPNQLFATDYNIKVTATNNQDYIFNSSGLNLVNETDPAFIVKVGDKLIFDVSEVAGNNHPFAIVNDVTGGYNPANKVSGVSFNGEPAVAEVVWDLTGATPGLYFYICTNHPNMVGEITVNAAVTGTDTDNDGVPDVDDVDDDNDGILDVFEGPGPDGIVGTADDADFDDDGVPNRLEIDSDKDGCYDVEEAGYGDIDNPSDGRVGIASDKIEADGTVNIEGGYYNSLDQIDDLDNDNIKDFLQKGSALRKTLDPISVNVLEYSKVTFNGDGATVDDLGTITFNWKITKNIDVANLWQDINVYISENPNHPGIYSGINTNELVIDSVTSGMENFGYRLDMETPAFKCDNLVSTAAARLSVFKLDSDGDLVPDETDLDDDNDGIKDVDEGAGPDGIVGTDDDDDYDGDGVPNRLEIDSDKDGCYDVIESGLDISNDENNDGQVGIPSINVDGNGLVQNTGANEEIYVYGTPADLDGNGTYDFLEAGSAATVKSHPEEKQSVGNNAKVIFVAEGESVCEEVGYEWEVSTDAGDSWSKIDNFEAMGQQSEIMIVGGGYPRRAQNQNSKTFIELYVNADIPANKYKLRWTLPNQPASHWKASEYLPATQKGTYILINNNNGWFNQYIGNPSTLYGNKSYKRIQDDWLDDMTGEFVLELIKMDPGDDGVYNPPCNNCDDIESVVVDRFGKKLVNAPPWFTPQGFFKRKDNFYADSTFRLTDWDICAECMEDKQNASNDAETYDFGNHKLPNTSIYSGIYDDTLVIHSIRPYMDRYQFRAIVSSDCFACDDGTPTNSGEVVVFQDTDGDGIGDVDDFDSDNDGIENSKEGLLTDDFDGDGIPNYLDLDSDGDGCLDVIEAGFLDPDGDGVVGDSIDTDGDGALDASTTVDDEGKIQSHSYANPLDVDGDNNLDFLQFGADIRIFSNPESVLIDEEEDTIFVATATETTNSLLWWWDQPDDNNNSANQNHAVTQTNVGAHILVKDAKESSVSGRVIIEYPYLSALTDQEASDLSLIPLSQFRGHSYYISSSNFYGEAAKSFAENIDGGYQFTPNDAFELEKIREDASAKVGNGRWIYLNYFQDLSSEEYSEPDGGWVSGFIPNSANYQWQVSIDKGNSWTDISESSANYSGVTNDTLRVKSAPASFDSLYYRLKATPKAYSCASEPKFSETAILSVSSDPDNDGITNSKDLDDDNDGILDEDEGTGDTDGDGIPDKLDLDSDNDGCFDSQEAGFSGFDSEGFLCKDASCVDTDGKVDGHNYNTELADLDNSGVPDYLEAGQSPDITSVKDLVSGVSVAANNSSHSLTVEATIGDITNKSYYVNWDSNEPNDSGGEDFATIIRDKGTWNDVRGCCSTYHSIVEFNTIMSKEFSNMKLMGDYNGHTYYLNTNYWAPNVAAQNVRNYYSGIGGYLVIINDASENAIIASFLSGLTSTASSQVNIGHYQNKTSGLNVEKDKGWESYTYPSKMEFTWQVSSDDGSSWTDINAQNDTETFTSESGSGENLFTNGSLDGTVNSDVSPTGWTRLASNLSSDINNLENEAVGGIYNVTDGVNVSNSNDGGTWVGFHDRTDYNYEEGIYQNVSLEAGETYTISYEQANFGAVSSFDNSFKLNNSGKIRVFIDAGTNAPTTLIGDGGEMVLGTGWNNASVNYTAPTTGNYSIGFAVQTTSTSSGSTGAYLSIDGISIKEANTSSTSTITYSGYTSKSLTINPAIYSIDDYRYRVIATNPGFLCAVNDTSDVIILKVRDDFDGDGVEDGEDVDDDNDGIWDSNEGDGSTDTDGDGIPDTRELDSDGDGCRDVDEYHGLSPDRDTNDDGIYDYTGVINNDGSVPGTSRWTTGKDIDNNGIKDFQEAGSAITSMSCPEEDVTAVEAQNFSVISTALGGSDLPNVDYRWQVSKDTSKTWTDIANESNSPLIITGIGYGQTSTSLDGYPKFIEIYVLEDVNLSNQYFYLRSLRQNGHDWGGIDQRLAGGVFKKGDFILIWGNSSTKTTAIDGFFGEGISDQYAYSSYYDELDNMRGGNDSYAIVEWSGNWFDTRKVVDRFGDGYNTLNYDKGWVYRKSGSQPVANPNSPYYDESQWTNCPECLKDASKNESAPTPFPLKSFSGEKISYDETKGDSLLVSGTNMSMSGYQFRVIASTPSYVCGENDTSCVISLTVLPDFDKDSIPDRDDLDDDNDGILDQYEGDNDDDNDGKPNSQDLDSDGDGCNDVTEAGFDDPNNDGIVGDLPVTVDSDGRVQGGDPLTYLSTYDDTPQDLDNNNTYDFLDKGSEITVTSSLLYFLSEGGDNATYFVNYDAFGTVVLKWQISTDNGDNWQDLTESSTYVGVTTNTLKVMNINGSMDGNKFRLVVTTPAFACHEETYFIADLDVDEDVDDDGILNKDDLDDDNDGILDEDEGGASSVLDTDGDGIRDRFDLDSDGDNCYDVTEAGFTDGNDDGLLGAESPPKVDGDGLVTSGLLNDGYKVPLDRDSDGNKDFQQYGQSIVDAVLNKSNLVLLESETGSFTIDASVPGGDLITYQWQFASNQDGVYFDVPEQAPFSGSQTKTLTITQPSVEYNGFYFRILVTIPSFVCQIVPLDLNVPIIVLPDNDRDGVADKDDDDDDNDGILDKHEGDGDFDNDGILNKFDPDSDNDGCTDVIEAGYLDQNSDGKLGPLDSLHLGVYLDDDQELPSILSNGRVSGHSYEENINNIIDLDDNGTPDFLEVGAPITDLTCPESVTVNEGSDASFTTDVSVAAGKLVYQWEISNDEGTSWSDINDAGIMFLGLGQGNNWNKYPRFIELYVTKDIPDLSKIWIYSYNDGSSSNNHYFRFPSESASKGDIIIIYDNSSYFNNYFDLNYSSYDKNFYWNNFYNYNYGNDAFEIRYGEPNTDKELVDVIGEVGVDGVGRPWEYYKGWIKRKDDTYAKTKFDISDWEVCKDCLGDVPTNAEAIRPYVQKTFSSDEVAVGSNSNTLNLRNISFNSYNGSWVRAKVSNPGYACGVGDTTCIAKIVVIPYDSDSDGVPDKDDADDDNDGILDVDEGGETLDTDGDGIPNRIDLDSDGDGCDDVVEAGHEDPDEDGILGNGTPTVDENTGKIDGHSYSEPDDNDGDNTKDFLQNSANTLISVHPSDIVRQGGVNDDAIFVVETNGTNLEYQWEYSDDDTATWKPLVDAGYYSGVTTSTLSVTGITEDIDGFYYRVKITTLSLVCQEPIYSYAAMLTAKDDSDGDDIDNDRDRDSDNDGISNDAEGGPDVDTDNDGIPDILDLDSDNDGCYDAVEAGYDDPDGDGIPGTGKPEVVGLGLIFVDGHNYNDQSGWDSDENDVNDWQEFGGPLTSISHPGNVSGSEGKKVTFSSGGVALSTVGFQWQVSIDNGNSWSDVQEQLPYQGTNTKDLVIEPLNTNLNGNLYRAVISTPSFACGPVRESEPARLSVDPDNDGDGVVDYLDLDDDNDGIEDVDEFIDDFDGDGIPNKFDLDSDNDGCDDVIEAGFLDPNGDGILGDSIDIDNDGIKDVAALVDPKNGTVTSAVGYYDPNDLDENDVFDFLEVGSQVVINENPQAKYDVSEFNETKIYVDASANGTVAYQWQVSSDNCDEEDSWVDLQNSPKLMISGLFETKNGGYDGIELYAIEDIESLKGYGLSLSRGTSANAQFRFDDTNLKAGQYYILYWGNNWANFFSNENNASYKSRSQGTVNNLGRFGQYNITLWDVNKKIDLYGSTSEEARDSEWDTEEGWAYRKNGRGPSMTFNIDDWTIVKRAFALVGNTTNGNDIALNPYPIFKFTNPQRYLGVDTDTLTIERIPISFDNLNYRVKVSTPAFACDTVVYSTCANINVDPMNDTDDDKIPDFIDLDSDNDGIEDADEGCDIDTDGDGIVNCLDPDSDNDGCDDVIEAGFTDENGDGQLGPKDLYVDVNGKVTSGVDGYNTPLDNDENGIPDYLEVGDQPIVIEDPITVDVMQYTDTIFVANATASGVITKKWQQSDDNATTFRTLYNTPSLIITGVVEGNISYERPRIVEFKAIRDVEDVNDYNFVAYNRDSNGDGLIDQNDAYVKYNLTGNPNSPLKLDSGEFYYLTDNENYAKVFLNNSGIDTDEPADDVGNFDWDKVKSYSYSSIYSTVGAGKYPLGLVMKDPEGSQELKLVDYFGASEDGTSSADDNYNRGWKYRKDTTQVSPVYYREQDWEKCPECTNYKRNNLAPNEFPVGSYNEPVIISGVGTDTLSLENIPAYMDGYLYNMEFITKGFQCDNEIFTNSATLKVFLQDTDNDDVVDGRDDDTDNDGILDVDEGIEDLDGDGIPNFRDLDSDGDGCLDVVEAGFEDPDGDGYLGTSPVQVNPSNGRVINQGGYSSPPTLDLDNNGISDFREAGSAAQITKQPTDQVYSGDVDKDAIFYFEATSESDMLFQWQILIDTLGTDWQDMAEAGNFSGVNNDTLFVNNILTYSAYWFRVRIATPSFACGDTLFTESVKLVGSEDWDKDGVPDDIDWDDDNDGIIDEDEGEDIDTDGDGIPDSKDSDSDGDGCNDVIEAGFSDADGDGYLGPVSPPEVNGLGFVTSESPIELGYINDPLDWDDDGIDDTKDPGSQAIPKTNLVDSYTQAGANATFSASFTSLGPITYHWEVSSNGGSTWTDILKDTVVVGNDTTIYSGITDTTLVVYNVKYEMHDYQYRIVASTPSYVCGIDVASVASSIKLADDHDKDGIIDIIDLDDDNDGILDSIEGGGDTDEDGIPDWFDPDSDNDGCYDVVEAGFEDPDNDGVLCTSPVVVDALGKVVCLSDEACEYDPYTNMSWSRNSSASYITDSEKSPGYYRLTYENNNIWGSVFRDGKVDLRGDFVINADLYFGDEDSRGSGIAFNLTQSHTSGNRYNVHELAMNLNNVLSVEFDTRDNGSSYNDIPNDHSSLHINGNNIAGTSTLGVTTTSEYSYQYHSERPINIVDLGNIEDGEWKEFTFSWSASSKTITVDFEGQQIMTYQVDIVKDVLNGSNEATFGFTSDGYYSSNEHRVYIKSVCEQDAGSDESIFKGYTDPNDLDEDGKYDFQQAGETPEFTDNYEEDAIIIINEGADTTITSSVTYDGSGDIVWQMCDEDCGSCTTIEESSGLMLSGIFTGVIGDTEPSTIELYALEDIQDLSVYGIEIVKGEDNAAPDGVDYTLSSTALDSGNFYTISSDSTYQRAWFSIFPDEDNFLNIFDGNDAIVLYKNGKIIDVYGHPGTNGSETEWDYTDGWVYRKDGRVHSSTFNVNDWKNCKGCSEGVRFNVDMINPFPYESFEGAPTFSGVDTDNLTLKNATESLNGVKIRRAVIDIAYTCSPVIGGDCISVGINLDNDKDGIIDVIDLDDDNDGILDSLETEGDADGDGIPNHFDLDSDNDGCLDVVEAGFTDGNDDGVLGSVSPPEVDDLGMVTSGVDGYTLPADNDQSGVYDFLEYGTKAVVVSSPDTISGTEGSELYFVAKGTAVGGKMTSYPFDESDWFTNSSASWNANANYHQVTSSYNSYGQVWSKKKIDISRDFVITSKIYFGYRNSNNGGEGLAFVLQSTGTNAYASQNTSIGYNASSSSNGNISNAVALEFDTRSSLSNIDDYLYPVTIEGIGNVNKSDQTARNLGEIEDGQYHDVTISWNSLNKTLSLSFDGTRKLEWNIDMESKIFGTNEVYFGFTGSTSYYYWNLHYVKDISVTGTLEGEGADNVAYKWQVSTDSAKTWVDITEDDNLTYSGINNDTLIINDVSKSFNGYVYKAILRNPAFACDPSVETEIALLEILPDNDKDGIPDVDDVDDDNDGILDTDEGGDDLDGDGIPNWFDLDSDGDNCFDVTEAGFVDDDFYYSPYDTIYENITWYPSNWNTSNNPSNSSNNEHHAIKISQGFNDIYEGYPTSHVIEFSEIVEGDISGYGLRHVYNGHTYYKSNGSSGWNAAKASADAIPGAYLVVISSQEEWESLSSKYYYNFWLGLYQDLPCDNCEPDGNWKWVPSLERRVIDSPDGILGNSPVTVITDGDDADLGRVVKSADGSQPLGYAPQKDGDYDGKLDYLDFGTEAVIISEPVTDRVDGGDPIVLGTVVEVTGTAIYQWYVSADTGKIWSEVPNFPPFVGANTDTLTITSAPLSFNGYQFKMVVSTPAYACGLNDTTSAIPVKVSNDFDEDGIPNEIDIDDDNDGIVDTLEVIDSENDDDYDNDGIPNYYDLDSDDDGCDDVLEAGFNDPDGDGILCTSPVVVNKLGQVLCFDTNNDGLITSDDTVMADTAAAGYIYPLDADNSGIVDFKEEDDFTIEITTHPMDVQVPDRTTGYVFVKVNSTDSLSYQWQKSSDSISWTNVTDDTLYIEREQDIFDTLIYKGSTSDTLFIMNIDTLVDSTYYRVLVDIPSSPCAEETPSNAAFMTVVTDIDLDNDGIPNIEEGFGDTDGDGIPNYLDLDSDNDGIPDVIEGGDGDKDTNGDGMIDENDEGFTDDDEDGMADSAEDTPVPDNDGDGTPDFLDIDSDNDGIFDVEEGGDGDLDTNGDGMIDDLDDGFADLDEDGMADDSKYTDQPDNDGDGRPDYLDIDSDNDGIHDVVEGGDGDLDTNNDGVIDSNDNGFSDLDKDGMDDDSEITPTEDFDGDGKPNYLDIDSDNDGIHDVEEGGDGDLDTNNDGVIDDKDDNYLDANGDGMDDDSEITPTPDNDGDTNPDYLDIDSDNDGIFDVEEGGDGDLDTNDDGVIDSNDTGYGDVDGDGMDDDSELTPTTNTDGDTKPDYLDIDSDNDGIHDVVEGGDGDLDTNNDGVIDEIDSGYGDADGNGMDDDSEETPSTDSDGDGNPNYRDIDSDNDGIHDVVEGGDGEKDTNGEGVIDSNDDGYSDIDNNGMDDDSEGTTEINTDLDDLPDYLDIDSDNDGIHDVEEGGDGDLDTNNDGVIDSNDDGYSDSDKDGMDDDSESTPVTETDSDSYPDYIDLDSDNDGIQDVLEGGDGDLDTNGDGWIDSSDDDFVDADGDGMDDRAEITPVTESDKDGFPDYQDIDSDNDGIHDVVEGGDSVLDTNNDGQLDQNDDNYIDLDGDGMYDPTLLTDPTDSDEDGTPDHLDIDSDNDGIHDVTESGDGNLDTNGDGAIDSGDNGYSDNDNDGMDDDSEPTNPFDSDGDGLPNHLELDSDNDGIYDVEEGGDGSLDTNDDGVIDSNDDGFSDADADGMDDDAESTPVTNTDNDNYPDFVDIDSDNDGIQDVIEGGDGSLDTNGDGRIDSQDTNDDFVFADDDGDGMADDSEDTPVIDTDGDGANDYQDLDSDNDGIHDVIEGGDGIDADFDEDGVNEFSDLDTNNDGMIDEDDEGYADTDNDGMADQSEGTGQPNSDVTEDFDDGTPNYLDLDSDDDGCNDVVEAGFSDLDGDGVLGVGDPEVDENGQVLTDDQDGYEEPVDTDNNGILDCYDALVLVTSIDSQPQYAGTVFQGDDVSYAVGVSVDGDLPAEYQWQQGVVSEDEQDTTWTDLANDLQFSGVDTDSMTITNVSFEEFDNTLYRVMVTAKGYKCAFVLSDPVVLDVKFRDLHIPQGISPNSDGTNDTWFITGIDYYPNNTVQIYNRWELKVFEMEGYVNEDPSKNFEGIANFGNTNGKLLPETVYFYVIDLGDTDLDGNAVEEDNRYRKGYIYIRRGND